MIYVRNSKYGPIGTLPFVGSRSILVSPASLNAIDRTIIGEVAKVELIVPGMEVENVVNTPEVVETQPVFLGGSEIPKVVEPIEQTQIIEPTYTEPVVDQEVPQEQTFEQAVDSVVGFTTENDGVEASVADAVKEVEQTIPEIVVPEYNLQTASEFSQAVESKVPEEMSVDIPGAFNDEFVVLAEAINNLEKFNEVQISDMKVTLNGLIDRLETFEKRTGDMIKELNREISKAKERVDTDNKAILTSVKTETQRVVDQANGLQYGQDMSQLGRVA